MPASEARLYAELFLDLKGRKKKRLDWITIAEKCKTLADRYNTHTELAEKLGVSTHLIRTIISLLNLPPEVREMVRKGEILYDAAYRLHTLDGQNRQVAVARVIRNLPSHVQREIIQYARRFPGSDPTFFRDKVAQKGPKPERIHVLVLRVQEEELAALRNLSRKEGASVESIVSRAINQLLAAEGTQ